MFSVLFCVRQNDNLKQLLSIQSVIVALLKKLNRINSFEHAYERFTADDPCQENMRGQRGTLRALVVICHRH